MDTAIQAGPQALAAAIAAHPGILAHRSYVEAAIDRQQNPVLRSQLRQTFASAVVRAQSEQARQRREALRHQEAASGSAIAGPSTGPAGNNSGSYSGIGSGIGSSIGNSRSQPQLAAGVLTPAQMAAAAAHQASAQIPQGAHMHQVPSPLPAVVPVAPHRAPSSTAGASSVAGSSSIFSAAGAGMSSSLALAGPVVPTVPPLQHPQQAQAHAPTPHQLQVPHQHQYHHHQQQPQAQNHIQNQNQNLNQPHTAQAQPAQAAAAAAAAATAATAAFDVPDPANAARVFKIQYDARRLICCSQRSVIVGWDFCNGDAELEEASRFYGPVD